MHGIVDQEEHAGETQRHSPGLLERNGLPKEQKCEEHREDRAEGAEDSRVERRGHGDRGKEGELWDEQPRHRGQEDLSIVLPGDLFLRKKCRQEPEQDARTRGPQGEEDNGRYQLRVGYVLAEYQVKPEDGIRPRYRQVPCEFVPIHLGFYNLSCQGSIIAMALATPDFLYNKDLFLKI